MSFLRRDIQTLAIAITALSMLGPAHAANTSVDDLLNMTDQLDQMDKVDFDRALLDANRCTKARDFACSEAQLRVARKVANGANAKNQLRQAEEGLLAEKKQLEDELLALERRQEELERAEARLRETERQAQVVREADSGMSTAEGAVLFAGLLSQSLRSQATARAMEQANTRRFDAQQADVAANIARDQQRFAQERARLEAQRAALHQQQRQVATPPPPVRLMPPQFIAQVASPTQATTTRESRDLTLRSPQAVQPVPRDVVIPASASPQTMPPAGTPRTGPSDNPKTAAAPSAADASAANMPEALAFCWQTKLGNWLCDGKNQDTTIADKDLDRQIALVNCKQPVRLTRDMVTLTSLRVAAWGQKVGWLYSCGEKLQPGNTGHVTWNRDIRRFWDGIKF